MKKHLSLAAVTLLLVVSSASDSRALLAVVGGNPLVTNVAVSSTHVCITTRAGFKCFTKDGTVVSPGIARCDTNGDPIRPVPFAAGAQLVSTFFSQSCAGSR
jgi:hypothetical protein